MRKCRFVSNNPNRGIPGDNAPDTDFFFHGFNENKETGAEAIIEDPTGRVFEVRATNINFVSPPEEGTATERLLAKLLSDSMEQQAVESLLFPAPSRGEREAWKARNFGKHYANTPPEQQLTSLEMQLLDSIRDAKLTTPGGDVQLVLLLVDVKDMEQNLAQAGTPYFLKKVVYRAELEADRHNIQRPGNKRVGVLGNRTAAMHKLFEDMFQGRDVEPFFGSREWLDKYRPMKGGVTEAVATFNFDEMERKVLLEEAGRRFVEKVLPWIEKNIAETETSKFEVHIISPGRLRFFCPANSDKLNLVWLPEQNGLNVSGAFVDEALNLPHVDNPVGYNEQQPKPLDWDAVPGVKTKGETE